MRSRCFLSGLTKMYYLQIRKKTKKKKIGNKKLPLVDHNNPVATFTWFFSFCSLVFFFFFFFSFTLDFSFFASICFWFCFFFFFLLCFLSFFWYFSFLFVFWFCFWVCLPLFFNIYFFFYLFFRVNLYKPHFLSSYFSSQPNTMRENLIFYVLLLFHPLTKRTLNVWTKKE